MQTLGLNAFLLILNALCMFVFSPQRMRTAVDWLSFRVLQVLPVCGDLPGRREPSFAMDIMREGALFPPTRGCWKKMQCADCVRGPRGERGNLSEQFPHLSLHLLFVCFLGRTLY